MKTTIKLLALTVIVVLSSCGTSSVAILKRKYNTGYYVDLGNKKFTTHINVIASPKPEKDKSTISKLKKETSVEKTNVEETVTKTKQKDIGYPLTASKDNSICIPSSKNTKSLKTIASTASASQIKSQAPFKESKFNKIMASKFNKKIKKLKSADDTELILLVILSFLLPPLAVFLKSGLETNFWISLILTLLFWLPGVIFALLVVFDKI